MNEELLTEIRKFLVEVQAVIKCPVVNCLDCESEICQFYQALVQAKKLVAKIDQMV